MKVMNGGLLVCVVFASCFAASDVMAKPPLPNYQNSNLDDLPKTALEADAAAVTIAIEQAMEQHLPKVVEAATTTAAFETGVGASKALELGAKASAVVSKGLKTKGVIDTGMQLYGLGGAVADFQNLGVEKGSIAAYERLSKIDSARPWLALGKYLGEAVAKAVWEWEKNNQVAGRSEQAPQQQESDIAASTSTYETDLHKINLDDLHGDWCKCEVPGCSANMDIDSGEAFVQYGCTKCGKINVKYARMALSLEQNLLQVGKEGTWYGNRSDAVKAAQGN